jgi:uncharacterized protein YdeI (YjbR/CyaY-like superfamily)
MRPSAESIRFFKNAAALRRWFEKNHDREPVLQIGFHKKATGKPSVTYPEALDEALCFGWIDGVRPSIDTESYTTRFTPRKARSPWSKVNINRVGQLKKLGRMHSAGLRAFESRDKTRDTAYSREDGMGELDAAAQREFKKHRHAWTKWQARPPGYRRSASWWVMSAKKPETRARRLAILIDATAAGKNPPPLTRPGEKNVVK